MIIWKGKQWSIEKIHKMILHMRDRTNKNNLWRTFYYKQYWRLHPEIPWTLLAHMVSRNAGYAMTDLDRYKYRAPHGVGVIGLLNSEIESLFVFLEAGNFLIYRDVFPPLEVYRWAKRAPDQRDHLFKILDAPEFDLDPFVTARWKQFFTLAHNHSWVPPWEEIKQHSFAIIINEQNQIEDRLVHDPSNRYLGPISAAAFLWTISPRWIIEKANDLGMTRLCFPVATSPTDTTPQHLLIYTVGDFLNLNDRIQTGRDLFVGLFEDLQRRKLIESWVKGQSHRHKGTRADYNPDDYDAHPMAITVGGKKYSPALDYVDVYPYEPIWPYNVAQHYPHLHQTPVPLPFPVQAQVQRGKLDLDTALAPLHAPQKPLQVCQLDELCEVPF